MDNAFAVLGLEPAAPGALRVVTATITRATADVALLRTRDGVDAVMPVSEFYPDRRWAPGDRFELLVVSDGDRPLLSAVRPELVEALYAGVSPEVRAGQVRVMGVARAPGVRAKVAVAATVAGVDPVAACVGRAANRVQTVSRALGGERLDVVAWNPDRVTFLRNALAPAQVGEVRIDGHTATVHAPAHQMSAAVGGGGLNSALAGQLVGLLVTVAAA